MRLSLRCGTSFRVGGNHAARGVHCGLKECSGRDISYRHFIGHAVLVKIICRNEITLVVPQANAESLDGLHAVVMIVSIICEDSQRSDHAFLVEGFDN